MSCGKRENRENCLLGRQRNLQWTSKINRNTAQPVMGMPNDIINFLHDPLACAIALGWDDGVEISELPLMLEERDGWLHERAHPSEGPVRVVTKIDGARFNEL